MNHPVWISSVVLSIFLVLSGCANPSGTVSAAPPSTDDAALLHRMDTVMRQATPSMAVSLKLSADQVKTGDPIVAEVRTSTTGYVYLFQIGTDGRSLSLVFPNAMDGANFVAAGTTVGLPRPSWRMSARGPAGVGHLMAVVTDKPLDIMALQINTIQGMLQVTLPYGAAMATLREVSP